MRETLINQGWQRHSVITEISKILPLLPDSIQTLSANLVFIVSTYDCAVIHECFEVEPWVQLLAAFPIKFEKRYSERRNPRTLHFRIDTNDSKTPYEINAQGICQIDRKLLLEIKPNPGFVISKEDSFSLKYWLAERYQRDSWQDSFNDAFRGKPENRLKSFYKRYNEFVSGLYLKIENSNSNAYEISVILLIGNIREFVKYLREIKNWQDKPLDDVKREIVNELDIAFGDSVQIVNDRTTPNKKAIEIIDEGEMTVCQLRKYTRFSPSSLSTYEDGLLPVDMGSQKLPS